MFIKFKTQNLNECYKHTNWDYEKGLYTRGNNLTMPTTKTFEIKSQSHRKTILIEACGYGVVITKRRWLKTTYKIVSPSS